MYRFSRRFPNISKPNDLALLTSEYLRSGTPVLDLTSSNPTHCFAEYPHAEIQQALSQANDYRYQPDPFGSIVAREHIAHSYRQAYLQIDPRQLLLTASTSEAYQFLFKLLCDPGDQILVPSPSYPLFEYLAAFENVQPVPYRLRYDGAWYLDVSDLRQQITDRTRGIIIVNPNNPTGTFLTRPEQDELLSLAAELRLPIISDEVFADFALHPRANLSTTMIGFDSVVSFSLNGLSKSAGMPQLKLAWIAINGPVSDVDAVRDRLELISDTYLSVSTPVQQALGRLLQIGSSFRSIIRDRLLRNLAQLDNTLKGTTGQCLQLDGGWSAIVQIPRTRTDDQWALGLLKQQSVLVQPGYFFDMPSGAYLVVSLLTDPNAFAEGLLRIKSHLSGV